MHEVEARGLFTFCVSVWSPSKNSSNILWHVRHTHCLQPFNTRDGDVLLSTSPSTIHFFRCIRMSPSTIKRPHDVTGRQRPFSFSVSWSHTSSSQPRCTHERRFRQHPSLLSFPPAVSCFARNNLPHAPSSHSRVLITFSQMIVNIATCSASSLHPTPPPRQI